MSESTLNKTASDCKPKPSPKPKITQQMKRVTLNAEIGEEYADVYDESKPKVVPNRAKKEDREPKLDEEYVDIYDEYIMPED